MLVAAQRKAKAAAEIRYLSHFPYRVGSAPVGTDVCGVESLKSPVQADNRYWFCHLTP